MTLKTNKHDLVPSPILNKISNFQRDKEWSYAGPPELDNLPDTEKMMLIRERKRQNSETVRKFFGSDLKIDVSLSVIEKYKLPAMLESDLPLAYFLCYLLKYHGVENLFFLQAVRRFSEQSFDHVNQRILEAHRIYDYFIEENRPMQINTTAAIKAHLQENLKLAPNGLFKEAASESYGLLIQLYDRFLQSEYYSLMQTELQANEFPESYRIKSGRQEAEVPRTSEITYSGSIYPFKAYQSATNHIKSVTKGMFKKYDEGFISKRDSYMRGHQIQLMLHSFFSDRLLIEFEEPQRVSIISELSLPAESSTLE